MKNKLIIFMMILITFFVDSNIVFAAKKKSEKSSEKIQVKLEKCVDGDTARFTYKNSTIKARFLAIDTPESVHPKKEVEPYGKEASKYTCDMLSNAKKIILEYDIKSDKTDKYDRHLVWVFVDDELLQTKLVSKGYAKIDYLYGEYKYLDELNSAEETAKNNKIGVWGSNSTSNEKNANKKSKDNDYLEQISSLINSVYEILKKIKFFLDTLLNNMI